MKKPRPGHAAPPLRINILDEAGIWSLSEQRPAKFTMLVFYRGLHCPKCARYLGKLAALGPAFIERGVQPLALSMDTEQLARKARQRWQVGGLRLGYNLGQATARDWGLYLSEGRANDEPEIFNEPGLFLILPDQTVYAAIINSTPYGRPELSEMLSAVDSVLERNIPSPTGSYEMVPELEDTPGSLAFA